MVQQEWGDFHYFFKIRTREPGPVLGNLDLNRSLVWDPYSGGTLNLTCTRLCTQVPEYNTFKKSLIFCILLDKCLKSYFYDNHWCFATLPCLMGHRNWIWVQKRLVLARDMLAGSISVTRTVCIELEFPYTVASVLTYDTINCNSTVCTI